MYELYLNIKRYREQLNMSQQELAAKLNYTDRSTIAKIEQGKVDIAISKIPQFAKALQTSVKDLMGSTWDGEIVQDVSPAEDRLISIYRNLNIEGQEKLTDYAEDLVASGRYKKPGAIQDSQVEKEA